MVEPHYLVVSAGVREALGVTAQKQNSLALIPQTGSVFRTL